MSDILSPQGFEPNEALEDTDIQEVYQPTSGGIRRNKQVTLATLKDFFRKLSSFTANNIVESDGTGTLRTTSISTASVSSAITNTNNNTNTLNANINQGVKTTDSPIFAGATIAGHNVDVELSTLNSRVNQGVKTTDTPTFEDVIITGMTGTVESRIEGHDGDISSLQSQISSNDSDISSLQSTTSSLQSQITSNDGEIATLNSRVNQGVNTTSTPTFNGVTTDNVAIKHKKIVITNGASSFPHGLNSSKILSITGRLTGTVIPFSNNTSSYGYFEFDSTNVIFQTTVNYTNLTVLITYEA